MIDLSLFKYVAYPEYGVDNLGQIEIRILRKSDGVEVGRPKIRVARLLQPVNDVLAEAVRGSGEIALNMLGLTEFSGDDTRTSFGLMTGPIRHAAGEWNAMVKRAVEFMRTEVTPPTPAQVLAAVTTAQAAYAATEVVAPGVTIMKVQETFDTFIKDLHQRGIYTGAVDDYTGFIAWVRSLSQDVVDRGL